MNQSALRIYMAIMAERDAAIRERNEAIEERKRAFAERDKAMLERDAALTEYRSAVKELDEAITILQLQSNTVDDQQQLSHAFESANDKSNKKQSPRSGAYKIREAPSKTTMPEKVMRKQKGESHPSKPAKLIKAGSKEAEISKIKNFSLNDGISMPGEGNLGLSRFTVNGSVAPALHKWGNGGCLSACYATPLSSYPVAHLANNTCLLAGGRKMDGGSFASLLNGLGDEGYNQSNPLELKPNWADQGTNCESTLDYLANI